MCTLLLVDGNNLLYRAFFAVPALRTRAGVPTNAVFGFVRMLSQIRETWNPSKAAVVFDGGIPSERKHLLDQYKAQRKPMPTDLRSQIRFVEKYLDAERIARIRIDEEEADDVIASMARAWAGEFDRILIASADKDLFQVVSDKVLIVPQAGKGQAMGVAEVVEKTGVPPGAVRDWLALTGDSVDNIPGVPGVGPKTAAKLLRQYGSAENICKAVDSMPPGRVRETIRDSGDLVRRNVEMTRLRDSIDFKLTPGDCAVRSADTSALLDLFRELEFDSMARGLAQGDLFGNG
jgi:DNA polymerase-1